MPFDLLSADPVQRCHTIRHNTGQSKYSCFWADPLQRPESSGGVFFLDARAHRTEGQGTEERMPCSGALLFVAVRLFCDDGH